MQIENYLAIMKTFFIARVFLVLGSIIGVYFIPPSVRYMMNIGFFVVVLFSLFSRNGGFIKNKPSMYIYAFILGVLTGSTYVYYFATLGEQVFISAIFGVLLVFGIAYIVAKNSSEEKVFKLSSMILAGMIALLILEFVNIFFFKFGTFDLLLSTDIFYQRFFIMYSSSSII